MLTERQVKALHVARRFEPEREKSARYRATDSTGCGVASGQANQI